jgi:hypothetical protein
MNVQVCPPVKTQSPTFCGYALCGLAAYRGTKSPHQPAVFDLQFPGSERITKKIELLVFNLALLTPAFSVAVDQLGLFGVQLEFTLFKSFPYCF